MTTLQTLFTIRYTDILIFKKMFLMNEISSEFVILPFFFIVRGSFESGLEDSYKEFYW